MSKYEKKPLAKNSDDEDEKEDDEEDDHQDQPTPIEESPDKTYLMFFFLWPIDCALFMSSFCHFRLFEDNYIFLELLER
jgi:hypothetical protein